VDGFHTGYVLDSLRTCVDAGIADHDAEGAWAGGLEYYRRELFLSDGTPRYYSTKTLPLDSQSVAQGIQTLSIAARHEPACQAQAWRVAAFALRTLGRHGLPSFQRRRLWRNEAPHMRWVIAPTLLALTHLLAAERPGRTEPGAVREALLA
jgi:hypothetical protein